MKKCITIIIMTLWFLSNLQATLVLGDTQAGANNHTFSFQMAFGKYSRSANDNRFWLASGQDLSSLDDSIQQYGLCYVPEEIAILTKDATGTINIPTARPLANKGNALIYYYDTVKNTVYTISETNPIYGAQFSFFQLAANKPAFVVATNPTKLYYTQDIQHYQTQTENQYNKTDLLLHDFGTNQNIQTIAGSSSDIYAATADGGNWGAVTSTISKLTPSLANVVSEQTGKIVTLPYLQFIASNTIDTSTPALIGGGANLASIQPSVTIACCSSKNYLGLDVTAALGGQAAGIALIKTVLINNAYNLIFQAIASNEILQCGFDTVISAASNDRIRINKIATMITSTSLDYVIVARDNGTDPQEIFAAPILPETSSLYGLIANVNSIQTTYKQNPFLFGSRSFTQPLTDPEQINPLNPTYATQLLVGGGVPPLQPGNLIKDLYVVGDSVYIVIDEPYAAGQKPGTFYSQALFAVDGHIIGWTPWARTLGSDAAQFASAVSNNTTSAFYGYVGSTPDYTNVYQTQWINQTNLQPFLSAAGSPLEGIQGIFNFPQSTPGFNNAISLLIATGFNTVTIGQTGIVSGGFFEILQPMTNTNVVSYNNISQDNALVAAELAHNGTNHWLFAGGVKGLFVLANNTGVTWNGNLASVAGLNGGQTWNAVGDFTFVKKIVWDSSSTSIYVLTSNALYKIALDQNKFTSNPTAALDAQIIVDRNNFINQDMLLDVIIDNNFCILGTTNGLYSFQTTQTVSGKLIPINTPTGLPATTQLFVVSTQSEAQRNFSTLSNLYVLNTTFGTQQSRLNRFVIQNSTITPFQDIVAAQLTGTAITGIVSSFIKFNQYVTNYFTDGSWNLALSYFLGVTQPSSVTSPAMQQLFAGIRTGQSSSHVIIPLLSSLVPLTPYLVDENLLLNVLRESTSGALITSGSFGGLVNA